MPGPTALKTARKPAPGRPGTPYAKGPSAKSKTHSGVCSAAASAWVLGRKSGSVPPGVYQVLAKCRQLAKGGSHAAAEGLKEGTKPAAVERARAIIQKARGGRTLARDNPAAAPPKGGQPPSGRPSSRDAIDRLHELIRKSRAHRETLKAKGVQGERYNRALDREISLVNRANDLRDRRATELKALRRVRDARAKASAGGHIAPPGDHLAPPARIAATDRGHFPRAAGQAGVPARIERPPAVRPGPTPREQAAAHRSAKGPEELRVRTVLAKVGKKFKSASRSAKRAMAAGKIEQASRHIDRVKHLGERIDRVAAIDPEIRAVAARKGVPIGSRLNPIDITPMTPRAPGAKPRGSAANPIDITPRRAEAKVAPKVSEAKAPPKASAPPPKPAPSRAEGRDTTARQRLAERPKAARSQAKASPKSEPKAAEPKGGDHEKMAAEVAGLKRRLAESETTFEKPSTTADHPPGWVGYLDTGVIHADPRRFQYKLGSGKGGTVGSLRDAEAWNPKLAGVVDVWRDPADGRAYVVNGHNRLHEATGRFGVRSLKVSFLDAKTAGEARAQGALSNIAEGNGTPIDAAQFMREHNLTADDLRREGIQLKKSLVSDGVHLARLSDPAFSRVKTGDLPVEKGAMMGEAELPHAAQAEVLRLYDKVKSKPSEAVFREWVNEAKHAGVSRAARGAPRLGFGGDDGPDEDSLFIERTRLVAAVKARLGEDRAVFGRVASEKRAAKLAEEGNAINVEGSRRRAEASEAAIRAFDHYRWGVLNHPIQEATQAMARAKGRADRAAIEDALHEEIRRRLKGLGVLD